MRILYAEDEKQLSMAVAEILRMQGYEVDAVYNGEQAIDHLSKGIYDAAILDIMMPVKDGIQVLQELRKGQDYLPVILLTAKTQIEDRIDGLKVGADDYLGKPFDMRELLARLESIIRRSAQYQDVEVKQGNITLNCRTNEVSSPITSLMLNSEECKLLAHFMKKPGNPYTTKDLKKICFGDDAEDAAVLLYISYLNNKLKQLQSDYRILEKEGGFCLS